MKIYYHVFLLSGLILFPFCLLAQNGNVSDSMRVDVQMTRIQAMVQRLHEEYHQKLSELQEKIAALESEREHAQEQSELEKLRQEGYGTPGCRTIRELINWENVPDDPIFRLTFPQKEMLLAHHFQEMATVMKHNGRNAIKATANKIRWQLNPHPAGQIQHNVPLLKGHKLTGIQHKYRETVLFFPSQGQTSDHLECEVAIVGGGPSGLTAAYFLAKDNRKVVLIERKISPGGGMMFNEIVVQKAGKEILDQFGVKTITMTKGYYCADSVEATSTICSKAAGAGAG